MKNRFSGIFTISLISFVIIAGYLNKKNETNNIEDNKSYAIARIKNRNYSLKGGEEWWIEFKFNNILYETLVPNKVSYQIKKDNCYIIKFSKKNPNFVIISYDLYIPFDTSTKYSDTIWEKCPLEIIPDKIRFQKDYLDW